MLELAWLADFSLPEKMWVAFFVPLFFTTGVLLLVLRSSLVQKIISPPYYNSKRWGGLVIGFSFLLALLFFQKNFSGFLLEKDFLSLIGGVVVLLAAGVWDDIKKTSWGEQLLFQFLAASFAVAAGDTIDHIRLPLGEVVFFPVWMSVLGAYLWIIVIINSLNWFDGVDGLGGSISSLALLFLAFLSLNPVVNQPSTALLCLLGCAVVLAATFFNFPPAKVYLGTAGVWIVGFLISVVSLYSGGKIATTALILGLPIIDFLFVSTKRLLQGKKPMIGGDRLHFHESLIDKGWKPFQVTILITFLSFFLGLGAVMTQTKGKFFLFLLLISLFLFFLPKTGKKLRWREK